MYRYTANQAYLVVVLACCLAMTALASSSDDDSGWMLATAVALVPVILIGARHRHVADYLRGWPAGGRLCVILVVLAIASGLLDVGAQDLVGLLSTTVLMYLVVVLFRVWSPIRRHRR